MFTLICESEIVHQNVSGILFVYSVFHRYTCLSSYNSKMVKKGAITIRMTRLTSWKTLAIQIPLPLLLYVRLNRLGGITYCPSPIN